MHAHVAGRISFFTTGTGVKILVQQRCIIFHGIQHPGDRWQCFVFNLDQVSGFFCDMDVDGSHGSHGMASVKNLVLGQHVVAQMCQVDRSFSQVRNLVGNIGKVLCRHDGQDAIECFGGRGINGLDTGVGVGAS